MKICLACGAENKDKNKYCNKCGTKFQIPVADEDPYAGYQPAPAASVNAASGSGSAEKGGVFVNGYAFDDYDSSYKTDDFENEDTMIIGDVGSGDEAESAGSAEAGGEINGYSLDEFENEKTEIIGDVGSGDEAESAGSSEYSELENTRPEVEEPPKAPNFNYSGEVPVYRDPQNDVEPETGYIDHLRRLKGLLDDGIINEWEYEQKRQQILGLYEEKNRQ